MTVATSVKSEEPRPVRKHMVRNIIAFVVLAVLLLLLCTYTSNFIPSESMKPTLRPGDHILTMRASVAYPMGSQPRRGDIIVFILPEQIASGKETASTAPDRDKHAKGEILIKRIVGLPGERISFYHNQLKINEKVKSEPYEIVQEDLNTSGNFFYGVDTPFEVPSDQYFVLGDNRNNSEDSRVWGGLKREWIIGRYARTLWNDGKNARGVRK